MKGNARALLPSCVLCAAGLLRCSGATAQNAATKVRAAAPIATGTVMGHVYLAGSNVPARLVNIALQPLQVQQVRTDVPMGKVIPLPFTVYQTGLDGSYTIPQVTPGTYYVVVTAPGFLSPFTEFSTEELAKPDVAMAKRIAATLPVISVQPAGTTTFDLQLQRGASLSGTVRFDDGTPFPGAVVTLERKGSDGKWVSTHSYSMRPLVNAEGRWERTGLVAGEYRIQIKLELNDRKQSSGFINSSASSSYTRYELDYFLGDTARRQSAKTVKLQEDEQATGEDITIPVSKLHAISGAVVDSATGQALNAGTLRLETADTGEQIASVSIDAEARSFTFPFVPEGEYRLRVDKPQEARFEEPKDGTGDPNFPNRDRHAVVLRQYTPGAISLIVQSETSGIVLPVKAQAGTGQ